MTRHDDTVALRHMLDYSKTAQRLIAGRSCQDLDTDEMLQLALARAVEVVGEAAARVSSERKQTHPEIAWTQIISARNRLIHGYDAIDLNVLWHIVTLDLPSLIQQLEAILVGPSKNES